MKKIALIFTLIITTVCLNAQESFRQKFLEANTLMEENQHNVALPIWLQLQLEEPDNFNVNYKVGVCYIHSANEKKKALTYLVKAVQNTTNNYDPFSTSEKKSPIESYFYLARAYHINYELDAAMLNYNSFKEKISKKHYLFEEVDHHIEQCKYAKIAIENPVNIKVSNMGNIINSEFADYSPVISLDESSIYFTSRRIRKDSSNYYIKDISDGQHYEDLYVSYNYDGVWTQPELLGINTEGHEATVNIAADGQTLFIYKDDNGDGNIYISKLEGEDWSTPIKLGSDINLTSRETHAHVTPDGNTLYFVSDRKGGLGGSDIYSCKKLPNGEWAKAQNIGGVINTKYDEDGVFIHPDGKTMYFSSKGHNSIGGFDIFSSIMDENGNWSKPENIGYPVNSTDNDVFFVTSADGKRGYYSSFQEKGFGEKDIYKVSLEDATEKNVTLLTGIIKVLDEPELPENAQVIVTDNATGDLVGIYKPRKKDGKFSIILNPGIDYHIVYSASKYKQEEDLYIPPVSAYQEINRGIDLQDVIFGTPKDTVIANNTNNTNNTKNNNTNTNTNNNSNKELDKLKDVIAKLNEQITDLKNELAKSKNNNTTSTNDNNDARITALEKIIEDLRNQLNNSNTNSSSATNVGVASYKEFFNFNVKRINTSNKKYKDLIEKAIEKHKSTKKVIIEIESSASKIPTKTYGSNSKLAYSRAEDARDLIINELTKRGIDKNDIVIQRFDSGVNGPKFDGTPLDISEYEKHQYVMINLK
jgi:hypothetical protein